MRLIGTPDPCIRPLRVPPCELPAVQPGRDENPAARVGRNVEPVVDGIGGAWRDRADVRDRTGRPGTSPVYPSSVLVPQEASGGIRCPVGRTPIPPPSPPLKQP